MRDHQPVGVRTGSGPRSRRAVRAEAVCGWSRTRTCPRRALPAVRARQAVLPRRVGVETREVWLPDSFAKRRAPQLVRQSASEWLTQKSRGADERFPHHTFWWEASTAPGCSRTSRRSTPQLRVLRRRLRTRLEFSERAARPVLVPFGYATAARATTGDAGPRGPGWRPGGLPPSRSSRQQLLHQGRRRVPERTGVWAS